MGKLNVKFQYLLETQLSSTRTKTHIKKFCFPFCNRNDIGSRIRYPSVLCERDEVSGVIANAEPCHENPESAGMSGPGRAGPGVCAVRI